MNAPFIVAGQTLLVTDSSILEGGQPVSYTVTESFQFGDASPADFHGLDAIINVSPSPHGALTAVIVDDATGGSDVGTIQWTYTVDESALQYLAAGQTRTDTFRIPVIDAQGNTTEIEINVTVTGTNDGPVFTTEAPTVYSSDENGALSVSGTLNFDDVDVTDTHTASVAVAVGGSGAIGGFTPGEAALKAMFTTPVTSTNLDSTGSVSYTFTGSSAAFEYLQADQTLVLTYTITVADAAGLTTTRDVVINVTGSNDAPVLTVGSGSYTDTAVDNTFNTISGTFTTADKDAGETFTYSLAGSTAGTVIIDAVSYDLSHPTSFGTLHVNSATGAYAYVPNDAAIEGLKTDAWNTFSITVTDSQGGSDTKTFQVSFTGANDAAVITGDFTGSVTEAGGVSHTNAGTPTASGNLSHTDRDDADVDDAWTAATLAGSYGTLTIDAAGVWEYTLNNNHASVQAL
ncbi:MAG: VCBS domain-containing protein, partial [Hyphomicrobium sp.]